MTILFILTVLVTVFLAYRLVTTTKKLDNCKNSRLEDADVYFSKILKLKEEISKKDSLIKSVQATNKRLLKEIEEYKTKFETVSPPDPGGTIEKPKPKRKYTKKKK